MYMLAGLYGMYVEGNAREETFFSLAAVTQARYLEMEMRR